MPAKSNTAKKPAPKAAPGDSKPFPDDVVLLAGTFPGPAPVMGEVRLTLVEDEPCGLVVLLPGADSEALFERLSLQGRIAVPVADMTGANTARADYSAEFPTKKAIDEALAETRSIRQFLQSLPPVEAQAKNDRMSVLTLAASRQTPIEAGWVPRTKELVGYPLLSGIRNSRTVLEQLTQTGLLTRRFFDRLHVCGSCGSARMPVREVCVACASPELREEALIHHYRCAYQGPRTQFEDGQNLVCPKCRRELRHYGIDYDAPGTVQQCLQCNDIFSEADVAFICTDCNASTPGEDVETVDWYTYELTADGHRAVMLGRLPELELDSFVSGMTGHRAPRDLAMILDFEEKVRRRYKRPFTVLTISFLNSDDFKAVDQLRAESSVWDIIRGALRETDFIAALERQLVLLLPETEAAGASLVVERINGLLAEATEFSEHVRAEVLAEDKVPPLIDVMRGA